MVRLVSKLAITIGLMVCILTCGERGKKRTPEEMGIHVGKYMVVGNIERFSSEIDKIIPEHALIEVLAEGFTWSEGPLWVEKEKMVLLSDVWENKIYKWTEAKGLELYLEPSGYTDSLPNNGEKGSNGLHIDSRGRLVLAQHGNRQIARMEAPFNDPKPHFTTLASHYNGKRLNSPNDLAIHSSGEIFFTDPPYGLEGRYSDPSRELKFQGLFKLDVKGNVVLLTDTIPRPNGIAFSPNEDKLYIASSDSVNAVWMAYDLSESGEISNGTVFHDASEKVGKEPGVPDGLKTDNKGNIFGAGPGGLYVFSPEGKHLGTIRTRQPTSNCAFNSDYSVLYITANNYLMRVKLKANG